MVLSMSVVTLECPSMGLQRDSPCDSKSEVHDEEHVVLKCPTWDCQVKPGNNNMCVVASPSDSKRGGFMIS